MSDDPFWDPERIPFPQPPAASEEQVRDWEERHGVRLPATLARALTIQNGGCVRGTDLSIESLQEFSALSDPRWENVHFESGDRDEEELSNIIEIGTTATGLGVLLDGNGQDGDAPSEPRILFLWHDLGREIRDEGDITFDELIESERRLIAGDEGEQPDA